MRSPCSGFSPTPAISRSCAPTVAAAKHALERVTPAAILLDVVLSGDESWRMILGLRQGEATGDIPIVVTSSTGEDRKALHLGADAYLAKPLDPELLLDRLDRLTGNSLGYPACCSSTTRR